MKIPELTAITELQKELDDIKKKYSDLERIHKYTRERDSARIWELLYRPIPSIQRLQDLERSFYEANKLVEKHQEEICTLMDHVKSLEVKIKMVSVTDDDLRRQLQQAFTLDIYIYFHQYQHTALINLLIGANRAHLVAETTADHWRQRFEEEHRKLDFNSAGESKRKALYKYSLTLKTESPGEVNPPVLQRQLGVEENSCQKD